MKKLALIGLTVISLFGAENHQVQLNFEYSRNIMEKNYIMEIQPTKEILGKNIDMLKIGYDWQFNINNTNTKFAYIGLYSKFGKPSYNDVNFGNEYGLGMDYGYHTVGSNWTHIGLDLEGFIGGGYRTDNGNVYNTSTSVNKVTYVVTQDLNSLKEPDQAVMQKNSTYFEYGFKVGGAYNFLKNNVLKFGYVFTKRAYQVDYRLKKSYNVDNQLTVCTRYNGLYLSFTHSF